MPYLIFIESISENGDIFAHSAIQCPIFNVIPFKEDIYRLLSFIYELLKDCNRRLVPQITTYKTVIFIWNSSEVPLKHLIQPKFVILRVRILT